MLSEKQLLALVDDIYDVALDPSRWVEVLTLISETFCSNIACVVTQYNDSGICTWAQSSGLDDADRDSYASYYGTISPGFFQLHSLGAVITDEMHLNRSTYTQSEIYNDYYKPLKIERNVTVIMERNQRDQSYLCLRRPEARSYSDTEVQDIARIASHIYRVIKLQRRTHFEDQLKVALNAALDHIKAGVVVLDPFGIVVKVNCEAERIIAAHDGIYVRGSRLYIERNSCLVDANALVHGDVSTDAQVLDSKRCEIAIQRPLKRPYIVFAYPLGRSNGDWTVPSGTAVFITDTERHHNLDAKTIQELFGLTPAESRLAAALADGKSLQEYSDDAHIASSTARSTLKSIFKKTQTSRQAELVKLLLSCNVSAK